MTGAELHGPPLPPKMAARRLLGSKVAEGFTPAGLYAYTDRNGAPIFCRARLDPPAGSDKRKQIRPLHAIGAEWKIGEPVFPDGRKPLYALHRLAAADPATPVYFVEGEPCVDALLKLGATATTAGGAQSDERADFSPLAGRRVILWSDNDTPGHEHMQRVAAKLAALGCWLETLDIDALGLPEAGDVVDYLHAHPGATADDLASLPRIAGGQAAAASGDTWPDPAPLPAALPAVDAFPLELLPDALRPFVEDIADRVQCPPDFPAVAILVAAGSVLGRKVAMRPKRADSWFEVPNLWGAIVGNPGVLKSPALAEALRPLRELEGAALADYEAERTDWQRRQLERGIRRTAAKQKATQAAKGGKGFDVAELLGTDEDKPQARRYVVNDTTVEALGEVLRANPNGTLAHRDELAGLLKSLDREGNEGARAFYLSAWNGKEPYTFDRITRGLNLRIDAVCVSLLGTIQPAVLGEYLREAVNSNGGDGLVARFSMLVWPDVSRDWRNIDRAPDAGALESARTVFRRFDTLTAADVGAVNQFGDVHALRFDDEAQAEFDRWRESFERSQRGAVDAGEHPALVAHRDKYRKLVPALALLIHLADQPTGGPVGVDALLRAVAWLDYLDSHARRAYASVAQADVNGARALLKRIKAGDLTDGFLVRDVYRKGWSMLGKPTDAARAAELLAEFDHLREELVPGGGAGGRPTARYWINPKVAHHADRA